MKYQAQVGDTTYEIIIEDDGVILVDGEPVRADLLQVGPLGLYSLLIDNQSSEIVVDEASFGYHVMLGGRLFDVKVADERQLRLANRDGSLAAPSGEFSIKAPIPGLVVRVLVQEGNEIEADQPLMILEAMKMENEIRAPREGVVKHVRVKAGESIEQGAELIIIT